ncbi:MAG TPA: NPCBM/NEW2 domain-containing protein [Chloroflexota bacterium]|nr:NPCBM/NEW2 domain-containing protein [Chloroflexota bacterium]
MAHRSSLPRPRKRWSVFVAVGASLLAVALARQAGADVVRVDDTVLLGRWIPLSSQNWTTASTGWVAFGDQARPRRDQSFSDTPLEIGGKRFASGIGAFAPSEVVYQLNPSDVLFRAEIGINQGSPQGEGASVFHVFVDDVPVFTSSPIAAGAPATPVVVPLMVAGRLRLVVDPEGETSPANLASWGDAAIFQASASIGSPKPLTAAAQIIRQGGANAALREDAQAHLATDALDRERAIQDVVGTIPASGSAAGFDPARAEWIVANQQIAVLLTVGDGDSGHLSVVRRAPGQVVLDRSTSAVRRGRHEYRLVDGVPDLDGISPSKVDVSGFGSATEVRVPFSFEDETVTAIIDVLDDSPAFLYQLQPSQSTGGADYEFLDGTGTFLLGDGSQYLTDVSRIRSGAIRDDGLPRHEFVDFGKPLLLWGGALGSGVLLATVDETDLMSEFSATLRPGQVQADFAYTSRRSRDLGPAPRLYVELTSAQTPSTAFDRYRAAMGRLYPSRPQPAWLRYQWSTWYPYAMAYTEADVREQVDFIAQNLADLGPWHIVLDAGWYVAEGKPGSDFRTIDQTKFPHGIRPVVDYAHRRGIKVVLYLSAPFVDSRARPDDWLAVRALIRDQRSCLVRLGGDAEGSAYIFDFLRPCTRQYWRSVLDDFFGTYDVDGIIIDGLGAAEGAEVTPGSLDPFDIVNVLAEQTVDIYRFMFERATRYKPDAYIEGDWHFPMMAKPYANSFRFSDDSEEFSHPYPFAGMVEDVDYAAFQHSALGQPSHMGWTMGDPNTSQVNSWRLEAGLAMGALAATGTNLLDLSDDGLTAYRARLVHQRPFAGQTFVDDPAHPSVFGTTRDNLAFVGVLNRDGVPKTITASVQDFGLSTSKRYVAYCPDDDQARVVQGAIATDLPGQSFRLWVIAQAPGVLWTDSSFTEQRTSGDLEITLGGPTRSHGFAVVYAPGLRSVAMDGRELHAGGGFLGPFAPGDYQYDGATGILRLTFDHNGRHVLRVGLGAASVQSDQTAPFGG